MALTFADTHNMIPFLTKSDASEGFEQIIDLLNASVIQYALMDGIREAHKAFFSTQWKFLIHTILQCMRAKRTTWNEFGSSIASVVICLATGRKFNFSKYVFDSLVRNVDSSSKFYMYPRFLQLMINAQIADLSSHNTKYTSPVLTQKVFANMRRVGKGFSGVDTSLFDGMLVPQQVHDDFADDVTDDVADDVVDADAKPTPPSPTPATTPPPQQLFILSPSQVESTLPPSPHQSPIGPPSSPLPQQPHSHDAAISMDLFNQLLETCATLTKKVDDLEQDKIAQAIEITKLEQRVRKLEKKRKRMHPNRGEIAKIDAYENVTLEEIDPEKDADDDEVEPAELTEVIEVVTTAKLMTEVVTAAATTTATTTITVASMPKVSAARRRKGVVIRDPKETATLSVIVHSEP
nr:hypothetical protein [Tanacetum cinerariifolium]